MMTLEELLNFLNGLPEEFKSYGIVNGEVGVVKGTTGEDSKEDMVYRCDKPIISLYVDEQSKEICFFHQTQEEVTEIAGEAFFGTDDIDEGDIDEGDIDGEDGMATEDGK